ncbi:T-cell leukemia/lymphoma protein 1B [Neomonachus schauinslandi]|uniref:T-cell leukemia/lymphoma protein 1B n=1 Tax=Neomonachus schauinslandi TaxID=29088 RepID=A0A2Y9GD27_NEOSC|nr:T-cell leukemia/lymphoma protein 1B [Neomonachus schauinslandi]
MASGASPCLGVPPHRLWAVRPGIYEDEKGRTWVTVVVRLSPSQRARGSTHEPSITVHMWQMPVHPQKPMSPSQLTLSQLPLMWQLYPGRRYRTMDSRLWEVVDHGQIASTEQLILTQLPPGE